MKAPQPKLSLKPDPEALRRAAAQALDRADYALSERASLALLALAPRDADALLLAGVAAAGMGRLRDAIARLEQAASLVPANPDVLAQLARCLSQAGRLAEAEARADEARASGARNALTLDTLGVVYSRGNAHHQACEMFRAAIRLSPKQAAFQYNLASSLKFLGDFEGAEQAYEDCLAAEPTFWKAHSAVAQLRRQTPARNHLPRLQALLPKAISRTAQVHLHQALSKEFEDLGDNRVAFSHLRAAKAAKRSGQAYSFADDARLFDQIEQLFEHPQTNAVLGHETREPIFVIGMPRSGTTLVERILSSHPAVHSAGELQNFGRAMKQLSGTSSRDMADAATLSRAVLLDPRALGAAYLDSTRPATGHTPHFVDKLPMNFLFAGLIAKALPNAKLVCLNRHPLDTILSNFRQLFSLDNRYYAYADELLDCTRYVIRFHRLMQLWQRLLPGRILDVRYETLVESQEAQTQRLLAHCGLPWHDACLDFVNNTAPVATASAVQVRVPIHTGAVHRWKHYEPELREARALLEEAGIAL